MTDSVIKAAHVLNSGQATGEVLKLDDPLSFWGGFDPSNASILDHNHPQVGLSIANTILVLPGTRGSAGTPGAVAEALRQGAGPLGFILPKADVLLVTGVLVAAKLYQFFCPIIQVAEDDFIFFKSGQKVTIDQDQIILQSIT